MKRFGFYTLCCLISAIANGQVLLKGKIMDSKTDVPLDGATIFNTTQGIFRKAGQNGMFSIRAGNNDVLIFSSTGYRSDTIRISEDILTTGLYIGLQLSPVSLDTVTVTQRTYSEDSLMRRREYAHLLDRPVKTLRGGNNAQHGFGVSISPITYLSRSERQKRQFRKQFAKYEEDAYIDYRFSPGYVHRVTGLQGEELQKFMRKYRPSYAALRGMLQEDLLLYINDSLKKFKKR
jgi:hypothetical protein